MSDSSTGELRRQAQPDRAVAIVTGSAVGIGRALCSAFAARGMHVFGFDIDTEANATTAAIVGVSMSPVTCDVGDAAAVKAAVDQVVARTGRVDVLVNNAAVFNDTSLTGGSYDEQVAAFHLAMDACSSGSFHCTAAVVATMEATGGGNVINMITEHIRSQRLITGMSATGYDCAKFAQWRLTESWAEELRPRGIRVNGLAFGATDTPMLRAVSARIADNGMHAGDMADAVLAIIDQGHSGPTGAVWDVGFSGTPRVESLEQIAAIRAAR
jgi:NAD(P)-dependent dehydrogenase (short-subunit alcohol dehydrogenase family)